MTNAATTRIPDRATADPHTHNATVRAKTGR